MIDELRRGCSSIASSNPSGSDVSGLPVLVGVSQQVLGVAFRLCVGAYGHLATDRAQDSTYSIPCIKFAGVVAGLHDARTVELGPCVVVAIITVKG